MGSGEAVNCDRAAVQRRLLFGRALSQYERQTMERAYKSTMEGHGVMDATIVWML